MCVWVFASALGAQYRLLPPVSTTGGLAHSEPTGTLKISHATHGASAKLPPLESDHQTLRTDTMGAYEYPTANAHPRDA